MFLNKAPIADKSKMQPSVLLSIAEGELIAVVEAGQIMLFTMHVLEDIGLSIKKLMILHVDCKGALDLTYGWNVSGLTKHVLVWACFLHELKEANQILCIWILTAINMVDMYTKNMSQLLFECHQCTIVRNDEDDEEECHKYLYEILDTSHVTITVSPGEGVASGQTDPAVGVGSQALPIPAGECGAESGEFGELLRGGGSHGNGSLPELCITFHLHYISFALHFICI